MTAAVAFSNPTVPNISDYILFIQQQMGIGPAFLPVDSFWIATTFNVAMEVANDQMNLVSPTLYTLMIYNLAGDRLVNFAQDQPAKTFFQTLRRKLHITAFYGGTVLNASDAGTASSALPPDSFKMLTLQDLQTLKTPWGRTYLAFAMQAGSALVGLS